jgi:hypothetical protein
VSPPDPEPVLLVTRSRRARENGVALVDVNGRPACVDLIVVAALPIDVHRVDADPGPWTCALTEHFVEPPDPPGNATANDTF